MTKKAQIYSGRIIDMMFRLAMSLLGRRDDAMDAVNDTMEKLWRKKDTLETAMNPEAFAIKALRNTCIDRIRIRKDTTARLPEIPLKGEAERWGDIELVRRAIAALPCKQREIIHLKDIEGYTTKEISDITGLEENHIRSTLSRARRSLKSVIEKEMGYGRIHK